ncbi:hypothetical protein HYH03_003076 [Edaphochlamys debaryana]|uniref:Uncharacterized protein n=1 Tax=Edaphochlamys debaryana TaxID=47281 RepID=A0A835YBX3_9CHLO|nr:hypothetical protein HYH03_003076 [Edaphochlamys debaryana]|eukprot:KAG2498884.1 hypothetical protein HYH03_003076 [Edaphochlamys debaryana]
MAAVAPLSELLTRLAAGRRLLGVAVTQRSVEVAALGLPYEAASSVRTGRFLAPEELKEALEEAQADAVVLGGSGAFRTDGSTQLGVRKLLSGIRGLVYDTDWMPRPAGAGGAADSVPIWYCRGEEDDAVRMLEQFVRDRTTREQRLALRGMAGPSMRRLSRPLRASSAHSGPGGSGGGRAAAAAGPRYASLLAGPASRELLVLLFDLAVIRPLLLLRSASVRVCSPLGGVPYADLQALPPHPALHAFPCAAASSPAHFARALCLHPWPLLRVLFLDPSVSLSVFDGYLVWGTALHLARAVTLLAAPRRYWNGGWRNAFLLASNGLVLVLTWAAVLRAPPAALAVGCAASYCALQGYAAPWFYAFQASVHQRLPPALQAPMGLTAWLATAPLAARLDRSLLHPDDPRRHHNRAALAFSHFLLMVVLPYIASVAWQRCRRRPRRQPPTVNGRLAAGAQSDKGADLAPAAPLATAAGPAAGGEISASSVAAATAPSFFSLATATTTAASLPSHAASHSLTTHSLTTHSITTHSLTTTWSSGVLDRASRHPVACGLESLQSPPLSPGPPPPPSPPQQLAEAPDVAYPQGNEPAHSEVVSPFQLAAEEEEDVADDAPAAAAPPPSAAASGPRASPDPARPPRGVSCLYQSPRRVVAAALKLEHPSLASPQALPYASSSARNASPDFRAAASVLLRCLKAAQARAAARQATSPQALSPGGPGGAGPLAAFHTVCVPGCVQLLLQLTYGPHGPAHDARARAGSGAASAAGAASGAGAVAQGRPERGLLARAVATAGVAAGGGEEQAQGQEQGPGGALDAGAVDQLQGLLERVLREQQGLGGGGEGAAGGGPGGAVSAPPDLAGLVWPPAVYHDTPRRPPMMPLPSTAGQQAAAGTGAGPEGGACSRPSIVLVLLRRAQMRGLAGLRLVLVGPGGAVEADEEVLLLAAEAGLEEGIVEAGASCTTTGPREERPDGGLMALWLSLPASFLAAGPGLATLHVLGRPGSPPPPLSPPQSGLPVQGSAAGGAGGSSVGGEAGAAGWALLPGARSPLLASLPLLVLPPPAAAEVRALFGRALQEHLRGAGPPGGGGAGAQAQAGWQAGAQAREQEEAGAQVQAQPVVSALERLRLGSPAPAAGSEVAAGPFIGCPRVGGLPTDVYDDAVLAAYGSLRELMYDMGVVLDSAAAATASSAGRHGGAAVSTDAGGSAGEEPQPVGACIVATELGVSGRSGLEGGPAAAACLHGFLTEQGMPACLQLLPPAAAPSPPPPTALFPSASQAAGSLVSPFAAAAAAAASRAAPPPPAPLPAFHSGAWSPSPCAAPAASEPAAGIALARSLSDQIPPPSPQSAGGDSPDSAAGPSAPDRAAPAAASAPSPAGPRKAGMRPPPAHATAAAAGGSGGDAWRPPCRCRELLGLSLTTLIRLILLVRGVREAHTDHPGDPAAVAGQALASALALALPAAYLALALAPPNAAASRHRLAAALAYYALDAALVWAAAAGMALPLPPPLRRLLLRWLGGGVGGGGGSVGGGGGSVGDVCGGVGGGGLRLGMPGPWRRTQRDPGLMLLLSVAWRPATFQLPPRYDLGASVLLALGTGAAVGRIDCSWGAGLRYGAAWLALSWAFSRLLALARRRAGGRAGVR